MDAATAGELGPAEICHYHSQVSCHKSTLRIHPKMSIVPVRNRLLDPWQSVAAGQLGKTAASAYTRSRRAQGAKVMPTTGKMTKTNYSNYLARFHHAVAESVTADSDAESFAAVASTSPWPPTQQVLLTGCTETTKGKKNKTKQQQ